MKRPNVLTILCDQLRWDVFSHRGNRHIHTPHLDRLAAGGVVLGDATCTFPVCGPARAGLLTGCYRYDGHYRKGNREPEEPSVFRADVRTVDQALAAAGYHVEYHGKWHNGDSHRDCYRGDTGVWGHRLREYHDFIAARYQRPSGPDYAVDPYSDWPYRRVALDAVADRAASQEWTVYHENCYGVFEVADEHTLTAYTVDKTLRFLRARPGDTPFAVTCSILHPHLPFTPNETYAAMFDPAAMPIPDNIDAFYRPEFNLFHGQHDKRKAIPDLIPADGSPHGLGQFLALYYALVKEIDDQVGRLLAELTAQGLLENTLIVFTSDHGDMGGSHNSFSKMSFYEESLRVPLMLHWPAGLPAGLELDGAASGADVAPTICDACGVADFTCHGHSLLPALRDGGGLHRWAYAELDTVDNEAFHCLRSHDWKVIFDAACQPIIVFDLANDPGEFDNVIASAGHIASEAGRELCAMGIPGHVD